MFVNYIIISETLLNCIKHIFSKESFSFAWSPNHLQVDRIRSGVVFFYLNLPSYYPVAQNKRQWNFHVNQVTGWTYFSMVSSVPIFSVLFILPPHAHEMKRSVQPQAPMPPSPFIRNGGYKCISFEKCSLSSPFAFCQYCFC